MFIRWATFGLLKLGYCRPTLRPQELKPSKTHNLEGLRRKVAGEGGAPSGGELKQRFGSKMCGFARAKTGFCRPAARAVHLVGVS